MGEDRGHVPNTGLRVYQDKNADDIGSPHFTP
jgi:hypothetical protein